jgi:aspartyl-tRNA synthetase
MTLDFLGNLQRTHTNGQLRAADAGARVILMGWVNRRRDHGQLLFIDVRDRTGVTQVVFDASANAALHEKASNLRNEYVVAVIGRVVKRREGTINPNMSTGEVEVVADALQLLNESKVPPFSPADDATSTVANEETRLKYRYLDLRRPAMQANIELRHKVALAIRNHLASIGFFEIETPFMTRSTPEGARDYLVPSRVYPGSFYALPQSPQLFKQILMISGFDRYFQIVRCFRDEDLRADRQPEFTQIDLEMTYPQQETVFGVVEGFLKAAFAAAGVDLPTPFPRMTYDEAIRQYGIDKPDLRLPPLADISSAFSAADLEQLGISGDHPLIAVRIPKVGNLSDRERKEIRALSEQRAERNKGFKAVFYDFRQIEKKAPGVAQKILELAGAQGDDDLIVPVVAIANAVKDFVPSAIIGGKRGVEQAHYSAAGWLRLELAQKYADRHGAFAGDRKDANSYRLIWITDFPMFEWDEEEKRFNAAHHPFTSPHEQDMEKVLAHRDLDAVRAQAYDVVLNGTELGSGSIRIHRQDVQRQIFRALGMRDEEARSRFGFFLEALEYGTPPHGGIALGLDRIVMILSGAASLREVIPFPKTAKAVDLMVDAPTPVSEQQLRELGIKTKN